MADKDRYWVLKFAFSLSHCVFVPPEDAVFLHVVATLSQPTQPYLLTCCYSRRTLFNPILSYCSTTLFCLYINLYYCHSFHPFFIFMSDSHFIPLRQPKIRLKNDTGSGVMNRISFSSPKNRSTISLKAPAAGLSSPRVMTGLPMLVHGNTSLDSVVKTTIESDM